MAALKGNSSETDQAIAPDDIYKTTGDYLAGLSAPVVGSTNGEWRVIGLTRAGKTDTWYVTDEGRFVGLAITINGPDRILLDYFAIDEKFHLIGFYLTKMSIIIFLEYA